MSVSRVVYLPRVLDDFDRNFDHLVNHGVADAAQRIEHIQSAVDILEQHPLIGRPTSNQLRELVIGKGSGGYLALYRYSATHDTALILAIRSQREGSWSI